MLFGSFKREIEERAKQETLRLAREWDKLSPEEKSKQSIADFLSRRWRELDEEGGRVMSNRKRVAMSGMDFAICISHLGV